MTSHLSLSCSVRACSHPSWRPATAAPSALVGLLSRAARKSGQAPSLRLHATHACAPGASSWASCSLREGARAGWLSLGVPGTDGILQGSGSLGCCSFHSCILRQARQGHVWSRRCEPEDSPSSALALHLYLPTEGPGFQGLFITISSTQHEAWHIVDGW